MLEPTTIPTPETAPPARVLLADDNPAVLSTAAGILAAECLVVGMVGDGLELVAAVERLEPEVVVLDITMPQLDGFDAARRIHQAFPTTGLVFLTVHEDADYAHAAFDTGALGYVVKSCIATDLLAAVREVRAGRTYISGVVPCEPTIKKSS